MDVQLPLLDGYAATQRIRADETLGERIRIIAVTAGAQAGEEARCRAAGMDGVLRKPVRLAELQQLLAVEPLTTTVVHQRSPRLDARVWRDLYAQSQATDPELLLFDEPTSALDPIATGSIEELIGEIKKKVTVLIVTHNMQQAARVSDYTAYMYLGELIEFGDTNEVFTKPKRRETEDYITGRFG